MRILAYRPCPGGGNTIGHVDVEIIDGVRLFGLRVSRMPDKTFRVFGPNTDRGGKAMSFDPLTVDAIAHATLDILDLHGHSHNDCRVAS
jgi:hypothetical protein